MYGLATYAHTHFYTPEYCTHKMSPKGNCTFRVQGSLTKPPANLSINRDSLMLLVNKPWLWLPLCMHNGPLSMVRERFKSIITSIPLAYYFLEVIFEPSLEDICSHDDGLALCGWILMERSETCDTLLPLTIGILNYKAFNPFFTWTLVHTKALMLWHT